MPVSNVLVVRTPFVARTVKAVKAVTDDNNHVFVGMVVGAGLHGFGIFRYPTAVNCHSLGEERLEEIGDGAALVEDDYVALAQLVDSITMERC